MYVTHKTTNPYLDQVRSHTEPYSTMVQGKEMWVYPNVMSPQYDWSSHFIVENLPSFSGKSVLEVGSGSGVLSLFVAFNGADSVKAVDINKNAVENTNANFKKYDLDPTKYRALYSDMFSEIEEGERFDTIIFNAPFHGNKPADDLERGVSDFNYETLKKFFAGINQLLEKDGEVFLAFSDTGDLNLLRSLIIENKLLLEETVDDTREGWTCILFKLSRIDFKNVYQEYIYEDDLYWFNKYKDQVIDRKVLKVGAGLGYASYFISLFNPDVITLDVVKNDDVVRPDLITVYNGLDFPYPDNYFDTIVSGYTLHRIYEQDRIFSEMYRVLKDKMVLIEELYEGVYSYLKLVYRCWSFNKKAGQSVGIHFTKYYSRKRFSNLFEKYKLKIMETEKGLGDSVAEFFLLQK